MNKRIKSIIDQASNAQKFTIPQPENVFREGMFARYEVDTERVAELMIEECCRQFADDEAVTGAFVKQRLKEHFGIKE
jgi:hypothetical protein